MKIYLILICLLFSQTLYALRPMAVAGKFYPQNSVELQREVDTLLDSNKSDKKEINALIVPHAGYIYSGAVAASAYKTLGKRYKNIFIIGSSHYESFDGASVYNIGDYQTPLGAVKVNQSLATKLIKSSRYFRYDAPTHTKEHTIEVQLPFLQQLYGERLTIVPIVIATHNLKTIKAIAEVLNPYFNEENLFVISSDLSHYPSSKDANIVDRRLLKALRTNNTLEFVDAMRVTEEGRVKGLVTPACGWSSLLTLLFITQNAPYTYELLEYKNSADSKYGDPKSVVGYGAVRVYKDEASLLSSEEKKELLTIARTTLREIIFNKQKLTLNPNNISPKLTQPFGAFVTLNKHHALRGCIGTFEPTKPLYEVVIDMTISAALYDNRFHEVNKRELKDIEIEISVLTPRKRVNNFEEITIGKHGIYIQKGDRHGTYLPQVATQMGWSAEEFVSHCGDEKAGLGRDEYKDAEVYVYEAIVFGEK